MSLVRPLSLALAFLFAGFAPSRVVPEASHGDIPDQVKDLVGTYRGEWAMWGLDAKGEAVVRAKWSDVNVASDPKIADGKAFVVTKDEMKFEGAPKAQLFEGSEGWFVNADGSLGDYYLESGGAITRMHEIDDGVWVYAAAATAQEIGMFGLPAGAIAKHVLVKVVGTEDGHETHRITRVTTASWKEKDGKGGHEKTVQFTSLKGFHRRD